MPTAIKPRGILKQKTLIKQKHHKRIRRPYYNRDRARKKEEKVVENGENKALSAEEIERLQRLYTFRGKATTGDSPKVTKPRWVHGRMRPVDPPKYRGSFQDKD